MLFLCPERAFHRSRPHSGKLLSDKVFLLFLLTERTASFYERCQYPVRLAVVPADRTLQVLHDIDVILDVLRGNRVASQNEKPLDHVPEFTDIAGPALVLEHLYGLRREFLLRHA